jgi:hypothetical protein
MAISYQVAWTNGQRIVTPIVRHLIVLVSRIIMYLFGAVFHIISIG